MLFSKIKIYSGIAGLLVVTACGGGSSSPSIPATNAVTAYRAAATKGSSSWPAVGILFAADREQNDVQVLETGGPAPYTFVPVTKITDGVSTPMALAVDKSGDLYVGNVGDSTIKEYPNGTSAPIVTIKNVYSPQGLAVDSKGNLWVSQLPSKDAYFAVVDEYAYDATSKTIASKPSKTIAGTDASPLLFPHGLAVDSAGNLFIADPGRAGYVFKVASASTTLQPIAIPTRPANGSVIQPVVQDPYDVQVVGSGAKEALYVTSETVGVIYYFKPGSHSMAAFYNEDASGPYSGDGFFVLDGNGYAIFNAPPFGSNLANTCPTVIPPVANVVAPYCSGFKSSDGLAWTKTSKFLQAKVVRK